MKKILTLFVCAIAFSGCSSSSNHSQCEKTIDSLYTLLHERDHMIDLLKYPASDRLLAVNSLIKESKLDEATAEIEALKSFFPNSKEAGETTSLIAIIEKKREEIAAEERRIKALGFKAFSEKTSATVDYNTLSFSSFSIGNTFTFDSYGDRYFYLSADRGSKFVSGTITIKSENKYPSLPPFNAFVIQGDTLRQVGWSRFRFARWRDYGAYLGNYGDDGNDFSKTSTIRFKLGIELEQEIIDRPFMILMKNENVMKMQYDRFKNPPMWYSNDDFTFKSILTMDDLKNGDYTIVKFYNKNKL